MRACGVGDDIRCAIALCARRLAGNPIAEAFVAVRFAGRVRCPAEWCRGAGSDRRVEADTPRYLARVARCACHVRVAVTGGDADDIELGEAWREREGHGVVDSRVGVDQNG